MVNMRIPERSQQTVVEVLARTVATRADKPFLLSGDGVTTFGELDQWSNRLAHALGTTALRAGTPVLLMLNDNVDFIAIWVAISKLAAIEVPINRAYHGMMLTHVINDSGAKLIIIDRDFIPALESVQDDLVHLEQVVCYPELPTECEIKPRFELIDFATFPSEDTQALPNGPAPHDLAAILYTSGTTGRSKGVMIYHAHAYEYSNCMAEALELGPEDVYFAPLPLFHIAGQWAVVYAAMIAEARVVITERFSVRQFWPTVSRYGATTTLLLDVMAHFLLNQPVDPKDAETPLDKVHLSAVIPEFHEFKKRFGVRVTTDLASTEMCAPLRAGYVAGSDHHKFHDLTTHRSCGRVVSDRFEVRLVDENDDEVPVWEVGELTVRAKYPWLLMAGYWNQPQATVKAWRNLWLHTGDALYRDEAGEYYFVDRMRDVIRRRGENISSMEIENVLNSHQDVLESAVFAVASSLGDEEIMAVIATKTLIDLAQIAEYAAARLPAFMVPRFYERTQAIPKTESGKIKKYELRNRGLRHETWERTT